MLLSHSSSPLSLDSSGALLLDSGSGNEHRVFRTDYKRYDQRGDIKHGTLPFNCFFKIHAISKPLQTAAVAFLL